MDTKRKFTTNELIKMNKTYPWNNSINYIQNITNNTDKYCLYATGECDLTNGRTYIALPNNYKINNKISKKYNLL